MKKRYGLILISLLICISILTGCEKEQEAVEEIPENICIYSYGDEFTSRMEYVFEAKPQLRDTVELVTLSGEEYKQTIDKILYGDEDADEKAEEDAGLQEAAEIKPADLFVMDYSYIDEYIGSDKVMSVSELGFSDADMSQMYPYSLMRASDESGNVKALTWKLNPVAFVYRRSMALEYMGSDDRRDVQSYIKDVHTLEDTLIGMKRTLGKEVRVLDDEGQYSEDKSKSTVFGFYADADWLTNTFEGNMGLSAAESWGVCKGFETRPMETGSFIFVNKSCRNTDLAYEVLKTLCTSESVLKKINETEHDFVNNMKVMSNAFHTGKGKLEVLGGEDYIEVYNERALKAEAGAVKNEQAEAADEVVVDQE